VKFFATFVSSERRSTLRRLLSSEQSEVAWKPRYTIAVGNYVRIIPRAYAHRLSHNRARPPSRRTRELGAHGSVVDVRFFLFNFIEKNP